MPKIQKPRALRAAVSLLPGLLFIAPVALAPQKAAASPYTEGPKRVLMMRVDFSDKPGDPVSSADQSVLTAEKAVAVVNELCSPFFNKQSYNKTSLSGDATILLRMPKTQAQYAQLGSQALLDDARAAASAAGYNLNSYNFDVVCFSRINAFGYAGLAYVGGKGQWLNGYWDLRESGHELGHNYGVVHASRWVSDDGTPIEPGGESEAYGDPFDTMGGGGSDPGKHFNTWFKNRLDWLKADDGGVKTITTSGVYLLNQQDLINATGTRALKIAKPTAVDGSNVDYWIEFRKAIANNPSLVNGLTFRWGYDNNTDSNLLDMTPDTSSANDGALIVGRTFTDEADGIHITPLTRNYTTPADAMYVEVNFGEFEDNTAPVATIEQSSAAIRPGGTVKFTAVASDIDADPLSYSWDFNDGTYSADESVQKTWTSNGPKTVTLTVSDRKGGTVTVTANVNVGGTTPSKPWIAADIAAAPNGQTRLLWSNTFSGASALWNLSPTGALINGVSLPLRDGFIPRAISAGPNDAATRILLSGPDNRAALWIADGATGAITKGYSFGPYVNWQAIDVSAGRDDRTYILWQRQNGETAVWRIGASGLVERAISNGIVPGWRARAISAQGSDGKRRVVMTRVNGANAVWTYNDLKLEAGQSFSPLSGGKAVDIATGEDNKSWLLYNVGDGKATLARLNATAKREIARTYSTVPGWSVQSVTVSPETGRPQLLWDNFTSGEGALWYLGGTGVIGSGKILGPIQ